MIKRLIIGFLVTFYFIVAVGVTISGHFCGGYLESYSFNVVADEHDCCGGMPMDSNCCENVKVTIKSSEDHFASDIVRVEQSLLFVEIQGCAQELLIENAAGVILTPDLHPPPLLSKCPVHLRNRVLLI